MENRVSRSVMTCSRKRKVVADEWEVSEIAESKSTNVHGVVTEVSPVKKSKCNPSVKYFDGKISDGKESVHIVSFEPSLRGIFVKVVSDFCHELPREAGSGRRDGGDGD